MASADDAKATPREILNFDGHEWLSSHETLPVRNKFTGTLIANLHTADAGLVDRAVANARAAMDAGELPAHERTRVLMRTAARLRDDLDRIASIISAEAGKEIKQARSEVERSAHTLELSAGAIQACTGRSVPMDLTPGFDDVIAFTYRVPVGVICAITPFNSPLNLVAHKIGPALAGGNAVVLKPSEVAPTPAMILTEALLEAGLPRGMLALVNGTGASVGEALLAHQGFDMYSFTGSRHVGEHIRSVVGLRRTRLELGNNSATIVEPDADLDLAASLVARQAFTNAGQVCISVQRVYAHVDVYPEFLEKVKALAMELRVGDPLDETTDVGPMISEDAARRAESLVAAAVSAGARVELGGRREGSVMQPTVLTNVSETMSVVCTEAFAPIVSILNYSSLDEVLATINEGEYGLQTGIFTRDIRTAFAAARKLKMGGVIINGTSRYRADVMPYGGVKASGEGREGPLYALMDMTDERLIVLAN